MVNALRRFWSRSREHANAAHILGARTERPGVVLVTADKAAAYCVAGRPDAIVVTTGATAMLTEPELAAVLAHERAHLAGRHPQLMMLLRALASAMPRLPLFPAAVEAVGRLVEMCADDNAARRHGPDALLCGLVALASPPTAGGVALGASDTAVVARAARLAAPARWGARLRERLVLTATLTSVVVAPAIITLVCHS
jgi:beta-lactamase regulating signal transducer with metallopeptidase domain